MADPSEAELLARARDGDIDAFEVLVRTTQRRVRGVLSRLLDDERDIDEAAQDTYVQIWRSLSTFRGDAAPSTWMFRIAVNEALKRNRRKVLPVRPLDDHEALDAMSTGGGGASSSAPERAAESRELQAFISNRLRAMPLEYRAPLVLRDIEGWSNDEVAAVLDVSVAAVKSRLHRARMRLRAEIERWTVTPHQLGQEDATPDVEQP